MRICLVTPAAPGSYHGNRVTADRWAAILRGLGHRVQVAQVYDGQPAGLLVALHARKSAESIRRFRARHPNAPVVLALTGTDLYPDLASTGVSPAVLDLADRLVVLQPLGLEQLPARLRARARVIYQSAPPQSPPAPQQAPPHAEETFDTLVLAHLRPVKDPLLAAASARLLPATSRVRVRHAGAVICPELGERADRESRTNPRYEWLGQLAHADALRLLSASRLLLVTSRHEGGANVVSEALAAGVPILATRIPGTVGLLGPDYPGYFPPSDSPALARLLTRAERDHDGLYRELRRRCTSLAPLAAVDRERESWRRLLSELGFIRTP